MYSEKYTIKMVNSYSCLRLDIGRVILVEVYEDNDNDKQKFFEIGKDKKVKVPFNKLVVAQLAELIACKGNFEVSNLWKVDVDKCKLNPGSTEEDIKELGGKPMEFEHDFIKYFQEDYEPTRNKIHIVATTTAGPSQQGAQQAILTYEDIINLLDPFIGEPPDPLRESLSNFFNIPDGLPNISTYLKFVDREKEVNQLMINMQNLHYLVHHLKEYSEPKKDIRFPTAVGTPGKGKTTFARRAYEKSEFYSKVIKSNVVDAVEECKKAGRTFRIACDNIPVAMYSTNDHESLFGKVLLYEALKYRLNITFDEFINKLGSKITLGTILKVILKYIPCFDSQIKYPLFIINIDETNSLFESGHGYWLQEVLNSLSRVITDKSDRYFLFVVLTGTHASDLFKTVRSSNAKTEDISLPLLNSEHAEEVLLDLANRGVDEANWIKNLSEHTKYAIKLLGVVGRFLEAMIFQMSVIGSSAVDNDYTYNIDKFCQSGLRHYLVTCQYQSKYCDELIIKTKKHINEKYQRYFDHFKSKDNIALIPYLVAYSLFEWPVDRSDTIGINKKRKIEDLEKEELIFLEGNDYKRIKLPFLTLHEIYSNQNHDKLPSIRILDSLDNVISPNQNEKLTISVLTFRLWAIHQRSISNNDSNPCSCKLSQLVPLRQGQEDVTLEFSPVFTVRSTKKQIDKKNWNEFVGDIKKHSNSMPECIAYHNMQNAEFADSFLITEPPILIQDKQLVTSRMKVINGNSAIMLAKGLVKAEHNKCRDVGEHIFLFVTDSKKRSDEIYEKNEIIITEEKSKNLFGDLLALRKLHCVEC